MSTPSLASLGIKFATEGVDSSVSDMKRVLTAAEATDNGIATSRLILSQKTRTQIALEKEARDKELADKQSAAAKEIEVEIQKQAKLKELRSGSAYLGALSNPVTMADDSAARETRQKQLAEDREKREKLASDHIIAIAENESRMRIALAHETAIRMNAEIDHYYASVALQEQMAARRHTELQAQQMFQDTANRNQRVVMYASMFDEIAAREAAANNTSLTSTTEHHSRLQGILNKTISIMTAMAAYRAISFLVEIPGQILETNVQMEKLKVLLEGVTGSVQNAKLEFDRLLALDIKTPFDIQGLTKTFVMLKNYGLEPTEMVMKSLTDSVSKLGGGTEQLIGIGRQLGQAWAKDKLQQMDMRPMIENGLPVITLLSHALNKNAGEILAMSHAGTIGRQEMLLLFAQMEKEAPNAAAKNMDTLHGALSNVTTAWIQLQDAILEDKSEGLLKRFFENWSAMLFKWREDVTGVKNLNNELIKNWAELANVREHKAKAQDIPFHNLLPGLSDSELKHQEDVLLSAQERIIQGIEAEEQAKYKLKEAGESALAADKARLEVNEKLQKAADALTKTYENQITTLHRSIALEGDSSATTAAEYDVEYGALKDLTEAQKMYFLQQTAILQNKQLETKANEEADKLTKDNLKTINDELKSLDEQHKKLTLSERDYYAQSDALKLMNTSQKDFAMAQWEANKALDAQKKSSETAKTELAALKDKYDQLTMSASAYYASSLDKKQLTPEQAAPLIQQKDRNIEAEATKKASDDATSALDAYNKKLDDAHTKTSDLGAVTSAIFDGALAGINGMAGAFDTMVNSITTSTKALEENAAMQKANELEKDPAKQAANSKKYAEEELNLNNKVLTDKLKAGSQIAGFLSSSLKKGSTEQRAAHAIQMGLAGAELAMNVAKMMGIDLLTMKEIASVGPSVASSTAKGSAAASEAVAKQATAGPYIGFALMAAMVVAMAAIGFATGGGGGGAASGPPPSNSDMGTGTVLGDPTAKSESINHTYDLLQNIHAEEYLELRGINKGVQALSGSITSAVTKQFQLGAITGTNAPNLGKSGHTMVAGGMQTGEITLGDLLKNISVFGQMYTTDAVKGGSKNKPTYSYQDYLSPMPAELQKSMTDIFKNIGKTFDELSTELGPEFSKKINATIVPALKIDTLNLSGKDAVDKANAVISSTLDKVSASVFSSLLKYQQLGEGMYQTAERINVEKVMIKDAFAQSGVAMPKVAKNAIAMSDALIQASGGIEKFQSSFATFLDKFTTDAEKQTKTETFLKGTGAGKNHVAGALNEGFNQVSVNRMLTSRDAYGDEVDAAAARVRQYAGKTDRKSIAAEKKAVDQYALLLEMAPKVDEYLSYKENLAKDTLDMNIKLYKSQGDGLNLSKEIAKSHAEELKLLPKELQGTQQKIWDQEVINKQTALSNTLMKAQGKTAEALADSRNRELAAMDPALRATQKAINKQEDLNKTQNLHWQLLELEGKGQQVVNEKRAQVLLGLSEGDKIIQRQINKQEDLNKAMTSYWNLVGLTGQTWKVTAENMRKELAALDPKSENYGRDSDLIKATYNQKELNALKELDIQLTGLQGKSYQALTEQRQKALKALDPTSEAYKTQVKINKQEDFNKTQNLSWQLLELEGNSLQVVNEKRALVLLGMSEEDAGIQDKIDKQIDLNTANEKAKALAESRSSLEIRLMEAQGNKAGALARSRSIELAAMDKSLRPLQNLIYIQEDLNIANEKAKVLAESRTNLEIQLMELSGNKAGALAKSRQKELLAMDESLRPMQNLIYALTDINTAMDKATSDVTSAMSRLTELSGKLKSTLSSTAIETNTSLKADRANANALLKSTLIIAKMGGAIDNIAGMDKALEDLAKPSEQLYSTFTDYARDQAITSSTISDLAGYADAQVSMAQKQLDAIEKTTKAVVSLPEALATLMGLVEQKKALPQFASGGYHSSGWRVVGENGPELEHTGASRIFSNPQSKSLLSMDELVAELQALRAEMRAGRAEVRAGQEAIANNTRQTAKILRDVTQDGQSITTSAVVV